MTEMENPMEAEPTGLRIMLPSEEHTYGLYLPEIFSAYNLYVDGKLIEQVGNRTRITMKNGSSTECLPSKGIPL